MENQENVVIGDSSKKNYSIKPMNILVVDKDTTCLSDIAAMLKSLKYEVVTVKHPNEALDNLRIKGSSFDLVITDVHMPDMSGFELQKQIDQEFKLPVVFMSADDEYDVMVKGLQSGGSLFIVKPVTPNDLKYLWQFAIAKKKGKSIVEENTLNLKVDTPKVDSAVANDIANDAHTEEDTKNSSATPMKKRFTWTTPLHNQFVDAIKSIGTDKVLPMKILKTMNVPGLTKEHISSHLPFAEVSAFLEKSFRNNSRIQFNELQSASAVV